MLGRVGVILLFLIINHNRARNYYLVRDIIMGPFSCPSYALDLSLSTSQASRSRYAHRLT
jgi:hypothetical protein